MIKLPEFGDWQSQTTWLKYLLEGKGILQQKKRSMTTASCSFPVRGDLFRNDSSFIPRLLEGRAKIKENSVKLWNPETCLEMSWNQTTTTGPPQKLSNSIVYHSLHIVPPHNIAWWKMVWLLEDYFSPAISNPSPRPTTAFITDPWDASCTEGWKIVGWPKWLPFSIFPTRKLAKWPKETWRLRFVCLWYQVEKVFKFEMV